MFQKILHFYCHVNFIYPQGADATNNMQFLFFRLFNNSLIWQTPEYPYVIWNKLMLTDSNKTETTKEMC